jgi:hypothetical protein
VALSFSSSDALDKFNCEMKIIAICSALLLRTEDFTVHGLQVNVEIGVICITAYLQVVVNIVPLFYTNILDFLLDALGNMQTS